MEDEKIRLLLKEYMEKEMDLINPEEMEGFDHNYSKKFERKMRQILWGEKYLGRNVRLIRPMRRAAMVAVAIISLLVVGTVSAKVFNLQPWQYYISYDSGSKMEDKVYTNRKTDIDDSELGDEVTRKIPSYIPAGMEQIELKENELFVLVQWKGENKKHIAYTRAEITENLFSSTDAEYDSKESIEIAGYRGVLCKKSNEMWIDWDDNKYNHYIAARAIEHEDELIKMGESLYSNDESEK